MAGEAGAAMALAAVVVGHAPCRNAAGCRATSRSGRRLQEAAAFGEIRGHRPAALAPVLPDRRAAAARCRQAKCREVRIVGDVAEDEIRMVLQILPDAGQMMHASRCRASPRARCRRRRTASAAAASGTRRRRGSPRAARATASAPCPGGIRRRPRACPRTGCAWQCALVSTRRLARLSMCGWI